MTHLQHTAPFALPSQILRLAASNSIATNSGPSGVRASAFIAKPMAAGSYENRKIDSYVGIYVLQGSGEFMDHLGQKQTVVAGDFLQMPPMIPHGVVQHPDGQWVEAWLTLDPEFADALSRIKMLQMDRTVIKIGMHHSVISDFEHLQQELHSVDAFSGLRATIAVQSLLVRVYSLAAAQIPRDAHQQIVDELCQILSDDLEERIDLPDLAARFPLSYERLRKIFKLRTGFSLADYRIRKRVERAQILLEYQQLPIKQVALMLGYPDPFTFSRQFRKFTGHAPSSFLRR